MNRYLAILIAALTSAEMQAFQLAPRIVVNITVDELRSDYIESFSPMFSSEGLRKLIEQGKVYEYERIKDGKKEKIQLRNDRAGHKFEGGYELPPHINDSEGRHFFYKPKEGGKKKK